MAAGYARTEAQQNYTVKGEHSPGWRQGGANSSLSVRTIVSSKINGKITYFCFRYDTSILLFIIFIYTRYYILIFFFSFDTLLYRSVCAIRLNYLRLRANKIN